MQDLSKRIKRLTAELRALGPQLEWETFRSSSPSDQNRILNNLLDAGLGEDLKRAVDLLRHFLWCYVESAVADSDPRVDYALQSKRLGKITEILRLLHHSACPSREPLESVERITRTVNRHMETRYPQEELTLEQSA
jgi:hypothetical protein